MPDETSARPQGAGAFPAGPVTSAGPPAAHAPVPPAPWTTPDVITQGGRPPGRTVLWFGGAAALVVVVGLVAVLVMLFNGSLGSGRGPLAHGAPDDLRPPLAKLCPPPSDAAEPNPSQSVPPSEAGPRTIDDDAGISYKAFGAPWRPWPLLWRAGTLGIPYGVGQHFVTEEYGGGEYHASILSAAVPVAVNDSMVVDLACTGRQVAADVRAQYYPQPNRIEMMRDELTTLGGRPAWVTKFRLEFEAPGLRAKDELVAVALIDVGRPTAAVLYVSIPGTHRQWDFAVDEVLDSVRPN